MFLSRARSGGSGGSGGAEAPWEGAGISPMDKKSSPDLVFSCHLIEFLYDILLEELELVQPYGSGDPDVKNPPFEVGGEGPGSDPGTDSLGPQVDEVPFRPGGGDIFLPDHLPEDIPEHLGL